MKKKPGLGTHPLRFPKTRRLIKFGFVSMVILIAFLLLPLLNAQQMKEKNMDKYVGSRNITVVDKVKGIRFPLFLMYPTPVPSKKINLGPFSIKATPDAPVGNSQYPLVIISHGTGGNHLGYLTIAQYLAEQGYIVAMPEHYGNNRNNNDLEGTIENLINRPRHICLVIDVVSLDPQLKDHVQKNNTAVIGHSMGGYTALAVAGGSPWSESREKIEVNSDSRVKAIVLLAPATLWYTPDNSLANVKIPILMLIAEHDPYAPKIHADIVIKQVADASQLSFRVVKNAGHFSFLSPFPPSMVHPGFLPSTDPEGFDRKAFHRILNQDLLTFLNSALLNPESKP